MHRVEESRTIKGKVAEPDINSAYFSLSTCTLAPKLQAGMPCHWQRIAKQYDSRPEDTGQGGEWSTGEAVKLVKAIAAIHLRLKELDDEVQGVLQSGQPPLDLWRK